MLLCTRRITGVRNVASTLDGGGLGRNRIVGSGGLLGECLGNQVSQRVIIGGLGVLHDGAD